MGQDYVIDLGINRVEVDRDGNDDFWYSSRIIDQGDLSTYYGYETLDASGHTIKQGKVHPQVLKNIVEFNTLNTLEMLKQGYTYVRVTNIPHEMSESPLPMQIIGNSFKLQDIQLEVGINPTFLLVKDGEPKYAVINGFLIDLTTGKGDFKNAMIYR